MGSGFPAGKRAGMNLFISNLVSDPWYFFSWVFIIIFSICVHEYAHALVALWRGDDTAATHGHLTLNPLVQMGPTSLVILAVVGIAWGSVPVNPSRFRTRGDSALVAAAGPASNLLLSAFGALLAVAVDSMDQVSLFFFRASLANAVLFLLNMLPVPMFDGWTVASLVFPRLEDIEPQTAQTITMIGLVALFVSPLGAGLWIGGRYLAMLFIEAWLSVGGLFG
jgi:Zn-dependent protease